MDKEQWRTATQERGWQKGTSTPIVCYLVEQGEQKHTFEMQQLAFQTLIWHT